MVKINRDADMFICYPFLIFIFILFCLYAAQRFNNSIAFIYTNSLLRLANGFRPKNEIPEACMAGWLSIRICSDNLTNLPEIYDRGS
jgi:hypothetical protein